MISRRTRRVGPVVAALAAAALLGPALASPAATAAAPAASPADRAARMVARMTLDEKIAMVHGAGYPVGSGYAGIVPGNARLGIPALYLADSPVGVGNGSTGVTQWADTSALASTWDTGLAQAFGLAYGAEQAGKGHNVALAPTINILRVPLWGRAPETYSEDPYLTAQQSTQVIEGIQSKGVVATAKHFVANNQEVLRSSINVVASQRSLHEIYQPAFKAAVQQAHVGAIMCSYNKVGGTYACENGQELTDTLRDAWQFDGMVMSDWGALHSTVKAAKAGLDLEMPGSADDAHPTPFDQLFGSYFNSRLKQAVQTGAVSEDRLDTMVGHILTAMYRVGLFDHPTGDPATLRSTVVSTPAHQALSTRIAEQGSVLLKNARSALPLDTGVKSIAVIGDAANAHPQTAAGGSAVVTPSQPVVSALAGITARAGSGAKVTFAQGTLGVIPGALPAVPASAFTGLTATYFRTADLSGAPVATEAVDDLDITGAPAAVSGLATWSARYKGGFTAPATGDYRFSLSAGTYTTVWIDGTKVLSFQPMRETTNAVVPLTAGAHKIWVESTPFSQQLVTVDQFAVTAGLHLAWQPQEDRMVAQAVAAAKAADVAVVVASDPASEGMDRGTLALQGDQDRLISAVTAANPRTVVVLNTASAVTMPWLSAAAAVVESWYPGQSAGTALAAVLFGDVNPSGKLPVTFPASDAQLLASVGSKPGGSVQYPGDGTDVYYDEGVDVGYRWYDANGQQPLFPFGFGLSYTTFRYDGLTVVPTPSGWTARVRVTNTGTRAGAEVAQLYVSSPASAQEPPKQLKAYGKVTLTPGETQTVVLKVATADLAAWQSAETGWVVHSGTYQFFAGGSSRSLPVRVAVQVRP